MENEESNIETAPPQRPFYYFAMFLTAVGLLLICGAIFQTIALFAIHGKSLIGLDSEAMIKVITDSTVYQQKILQLFSSFGTFWVSSFLFFKIYKIKAVSNLGLSSTISNKHWLLIVPIAITVLPVISGLQMLNQQIDFGSIFPKMQDYFDEMQKMNNELIEKFLVMPDISTLFFNIFLIAFVPAIGEELMFRGVLFPIFWGWYKNKHVGIILSAILFSFIHMQFFNFLPIILMGILFGYLYVWSGSIWVTMILHFINNALAVIATYLYQQNGAEWLNMEYNMPWYIAVISVPVCGFFVYQFYKSRVNE